MVLHGWKVVGCALLIAVFGWGFGFYGFGVGNTTSLPSVIVQAEFLAAAFGQVVSTIVAITRFTLLVRARRPPQVARRLRGLRRAPRRVPRAPAGGRGHPCSWKAGRVAALEPYGSPVDVEATAGSGAGERAGL